MEALQPVDMRRAKQNAVHEVPARIGSNRDRTGAARVGPGGKAAGTMTVWESKKEWREGGRGGGGGGEEMWELKPPKRKIGKKKRIIITRNE